MQRTLLSPRNPEQPRPYEPIETGLSEADIKNTMDSFFEFLHLPYSERIKISFIDEKRPRTGVSGYSYKGEVSPDGSSNQDNKHVFHMTQTLYNGLRSKMYGRDFPGASRRFLEDAYEAHLALADAGKAKFKELEEEFPGITRIHFPRNDLLAHHTRFLAYQGSRNGILASPHYDKSTATIAVAESHGGLRLGFGSDDLELIDREQYDPLLFMGYGYHQLAEMIDVDVSRRAAWHDVIDTGEQVNEEVSRWALVNFINPANIYLESTQAHTHTPIPWRGLGNLALRSDNASFLVN